MRRPEGLDPGVQRLGPGGTDGPGRPAAAGAAGVEWSRVVRLARGGSLSGTFRLVERVPGIAVKIHMHIVHISCTLVHIAEQVRGRLLAP